MKTATLIPNRRKLGALMFTDMVGSSQMFQRDEDAAKATLDEMYRMIRESVARHSGHEMDTAGDGFFLQFASAIEATECAFEIQARIFEYNLQQPEDLRFQIRIGIHVGEFLEENGRAIGDDVNIAARIEGVADPGGIAVSQQVFDHVSGKIECQLESLGTVPLKNISKKIPLYRVILPWTKSKEEYSHFNLKALQRSRWLGLLTMAAVAGVACAWLTTAYLHNVEIPAPIAKIELNAGWEIQINPQAEWVPFAMYGRKFADQVKGAYRLRKRFQLSQEIPEPTLVLGYIPDQYRIFLNGAAVGGADRVSPVEYFTFDPSLLRQNQENLLEITATTKGSMNPGLNTVPGIGAFLSDLPYAYAVIHTDRVAFHDRHIVSMALSALLFFACLLAWSLNLSNRVRAYQTAYLFGCFLFSCHYLPWFFSSEPYWLVFLFSILPLTICPLILVSSYFSEIGKIKWEFSNNVLFFILISAILTMIVAFPPTPAGLIVRALGFYAFAAVYGFLSCALLLSSMGRWSPSALVTIAFNGATTVLTLKKMCEFLEIKMPGPFVHFGELLRMYPFVFAVSLALLGVLDHARKSKEARQRQKALEINRKLLSILVKGTSFHDKLSRIQRLACRYVGIEKSTVYLAAYTSDRLILRAESVIRNSEHESHLAKEIVDPSPHGILGYVCQVRSPLLIEDLAGDARFSGYINHRKHDHFYTRSCMIFPLVAKDQLLAVMTFSDKTGHERFTQADFKFASQAAHIAQVLCQLEMSRTFTSRLAG